MSKEFLESYKKAESLERSRADTYRQYSKKVAFQEGKNVLNFLVKAEEKHLKFVKEQEKRLLEGERLVLSKIKEKKYKVRKRAIKVGLGGFKGDISIMESAIRLEKQDVEFYRKAIEKSQDDESRLFFRKIQLLEKGHLRLLRQTVKEAKEESAMLSTVADTRLQYKGI